MKRKIKIKISHATHFLMALGVGYFSYFILRRYEVVSSIENDLLAAYIANFRVMASTISQIAAALVGLMLAALAMLLSLSNHKLIVNMGVSGHLHLLVGRILMAMVIFLVLSIYCLYLMVKPVVDLGHTEILIAIGAAAAISLIDVFAKISRVLWFLSPLGDDESDDVRTLYKDRN